MNKVVVGGVGVAVVALAYGAWWYQGMSEEPGEGWKGSTQTQSPKKTVPEGAMVLDVRTPEEFKAAHAARAVNLPLQDIQSGVMPTPQKDTPLYVYCHSGNRSGQATKILKENGYTNITDIGAFTNTKQYGL